MTELPWYKDGLRFKCTGCGKCCTGTSGIVWVNDEEMTRMAAVLNLSLEKFKIKYIRCRDNKCALIEKKTPTGDYDCIFLKDKKCEIYQARPSQCKTYPWWPENLQSEASWKMAAEECEGINDEAPIVSYAEIKELLTLQSNENPLQ